MRKDLLFTMAMAALLTAGCSQNEIMEVSPDAAPAVGFKVFTDAQTRGLITNSSTSVSNVSTGIRTTGFGVLAYYTGQNAWSTAGATATPNFMYNQKVEYKSVAWEYTPMKYWPNTEGDKISFFAYAPYKTASNGIDLTAATATGAPTMRFTLQTKPEDMVDLVATNATQTAGDAKTIDLTRSTAKVPFKFKHVLTRASFKAKLDASLASTNQTHVFITGMRILGTVDNGANGNASGTNNASKFYNAATYKWADGTWDYTAPTKQSAVYPLEAILNRNPASVSTYQKQSIELPQDATEIALFKTNQYLFLIPPSDATNINDAGGITAPTDVRMQIDYDIVTVDPSLNTGYSITSTTATVSLPNGTLKRGNAYLYTFTVGLEKVQVTAEVENWAQDNNVYIPSASATNVAGIVSAIAVLNTTKGNNKNCNYFVINCSGSSYGTVNLNTATVANFVSGDKIELNFAASPGVTGVTLPTGWKADKASLSAIGKIILTKN